MDVDAVRDEELPPIAALFDEHCGFVWRVLRHLGVDEAALDDAVQDVFITAHRRWSTFEGRSSARTWLFGIARRIAHRYRRSARARASRFVPGEHVRDAAVHPMERVQAAHSLARMIGRLDRDKRAVFVLTEIEGMTAPEVSAALGIPLGTAYSRLRAAWQALGRAAGQDERRAELGRLRVEPSDASRRRMWGAIVVGLAPVRAATMVAISTQLKWIVAGAALGAGLVAIGAVALPPAPARAAVATTTTMIDRGDDDRAELEDAIAEAHPGAATTPSSGIGGAAIVAVSTPHVPTRAARPREPAPPPRSEPTPRPDLREELRLVRAAQAALGEQRSNDALALLDEHARRFPDGQLAAERRKARVSALCLAGRRDVAEREARALGRTHACD